MENWQIVLLAAVALALGCLAAFTWGSVGSAVSVYCLIMMGAALLVQTFLTNRDKDDFDME